MCSWFCKKSCTIHGDTYHHMFYDPAAVCSWFYTKSCTIHGDTYHHMFCDPAQACSRCSRNSCMIHDDSHTRANIHRSPCNIHPHLRIARKVVISEMSGVRVHSHQVKVGVKVKKIKEQSRKIKEWTKNIKENFRFSFSCEWAKGWIKETFLLKLKSKMSKHKLKMCAIYKYLSNRLWILSHCAHGMVPICFPWDFK